MSSPRTVEELERLLQQAEKRIAEAEECTIETLKHATEAVEHADKAVEYADEAVERADEAVERADEAVERADEAEKLASEAKKQIQSTTLDEYIEACHDLVFSKFAVETNNNLTTKGFITNPRIKCCPTNLKPWSDFLEQQRVTFGTLYDTFPAQRRSFESRHFLAGMGNRISTSFIAGEKTLERFLHNGVEESVRGIVEQLKQVDEVCSAFDLGNGIIFENDSHAIVDIAEEVLDREAPSSSRNRPDRGQDLDQLRPDQICVYQSNDSPVTARTMIYVSEHKPPHKLTALHLRLGLRAMNIPKDVVNRETIDISMYPDALFRYHADRLAASAITQTYHHMVEGGLEYGLLTTGEAIVFLKVDWEDPETLYYHLAEPGPEVSTHPNHVQICSAVGQYLAFTLMAVGRPGERRMHGQEERRRATRRLSKWAEDFEMVYRTIPEGERSPSDSSSPAYFPTTYKGFDRSQYVPPLENIPTW